MALSVGEQIILSVLAGSLVALFFSLHKILGMEKRNLSMEQRVIGLETSIAKLVSAVLKEETRIEKEEVQIEKEIKGKRRK